jgi:hypothetical protein
MNNNHSLTHSQEHYYYYYYYYYCNTKNVVYLWKLILVENMVVLSFEMRPLFPAPPPHPLFIKYVNSQSRRRFRVSSFRSNRMVRSTLLALPTAGVWRVQYEYSCV